MAEVEYPGWTSHWEETEAMYDCETDILLEEEHVVGVGSHLALGHVSILQQGNQEQRPNGPLLDNKSTTDWSKQRCISSPAGQLSSRRDRMTSCSEVTTTPYFRSLSACSRESFPATCYFEDGQFDEYRDSSVEKPNAQKTAIMVEECDSDMDCFKSFSSSAGSDEMEEEEDIVFLQLNNIGSIVEPAPPSVPFSSINATQQQHFSNRQSGEPKPAQNKQTTTARKLAKFLRLETSVSVIDAIDCTQEADDSDQDHRIDSRENRDRAHKYMKSKWNGVRFCTYEWKCIGEPTALMFMCHDYGEHAQRYGHIANALTANDFLVLAHDMQGHGRSDGARGHIKDYRIWVEDVHIHILNVKKRYPNLPVYALGQGIGATVVLSLSRTYRSLLSGMVLLAPLVHTKKASTAQRILGKSISTVAPDMNVVHVTGASIMRDPDQIQLYDQDPYVFKESMNMRLLQQLMSAASSNTQGLKSIKTPFFLAHGTQDLVVDYRAAVEFYSRLPLSRKNDSNKAVLRIYDDMSHALLFDLPEPRKMVQNDILAWLMSNTL